MNSFWLRFTCFLSLLFIAGCGGGSTADGNTTFLQASIKTGTTGVVFANMSGSKINSSANPMNFTLTSKTYSTTSSVPVSNVNIDKISFNYTPLTSSSGAPSPIFNPTFTTIFYSGLLPAAGTLDIQNVPILSDTDLQQIAANSSGLNNVTLNYKVDVTFHGVEVNTGKSLSNTVNISAIVQKF